MKKNSTYLLSFFFPFEQRWEKKKMLLITHLCSESRVCSAEHDASRTRLLYLLLNSPSTVTSIARRIRLSFSALSSTYHDVGRSARSPKRLQPKSATRDFMPRCRETDRDLGSIVILRILRVTSVCVVAGGRSSQVSGNITMSNRYYHVAFHLTF